MVLELIAKSDASVINVDKLTYAGNLDNLASIEGEPRHVFIHGDIGDGDLIARTLDEHQPEVILNFAAESHVDRSIVGPDDFIQTNVNGTFNLLKKALDYWKKLAEFRRRRFRIIHVSTDEVYGSLGPEDPPFSERTPYAPRSPYAASKAASDHLMRAYHSTFGVPVITTNCSNNYGPFQFPEKLIPLVITRALNGESIPIYGDGLYVRDWLYVTDHCEAIRMVLERGVIGETYNIGGSSELTNLDVVDSICEALAEFSPGGSAERNKALKTFVVDRPGHDRRYAIDNSKIRSEIGWEPKESFQSGIRKTVQWYLENSEWVRRVTSGDYRKWIVENYENRS